MTHVSKRKLPHKKEDQLLNQLYKVVAQLDSKRASAFLSELFGEEERLMFAKRLAAIILYTEGVSSYRVSVLLNLSPSTTDRIRLNYEIGKYGAIRRFVTEDKGEYTRIVETLERILQMGFPPRGRGRWKKTLLKFTRE